jgi:tetratricopeptide (TPR) repeat protein
MRVRVRRLSALPWIAAVVALTVILGSPGASGAQSVPGSRVLVMPFAAEVEPQAAGGAGAARWLGEAAAVLVTDGLTSLGLGALPRDERVAAFDRLQLPMSAGLTRATMIRIGEIIGASEIVFGEVRLGEKLMVRARIVRLDTGREAPVVTGEATLAEIFPLFERVAGGVASATGRVRAGAVATGTPLPLEAFENYVKGLVAATPASQQRFLEAAMAQVPKDPRILTALWAVYSAQGLHDKALAAANAVPAGSLLSRKARFALALSLIELKRFDGAYKELSTLFTTRPSPALSNALGVVQLRRPAEAGRTPATTYFARAVNDLPDNTDYLFNLGYAHALAHNSTDALLWLRETVRYDAADGDAHIVMAVVLQAAGRTAEAQRERELARLLGTNVESIGAIGGPVPPGLERIGTDLDLSASPRVDAAIATPAQRDQRETALFHVARGRELFTARRDREAINELRRAIYLAPYEDAPHLLLGQLFQRGGQLPAAIDEFQVALWCRESLAGRLALADALLESGDRVLARREADRALALAPGNPEALALIKKIGG